MTPPGPWEYTGQLVHALDADTLLIRVRKRIDFGFRREMELSSVEEFRLSGIDTPESTGPTRLMGAHATAEVQELLSGREFKVISTGADDKYGRWLGAIYLPWLDGFLADWLIANGLAQLYSGKGPRPKWDPTAPYPLA